MNTFKKLTRRTIGPAVMAGAIGLGAILASAPPAHAATFEQCKAGAIWWARTGYLAYTDTEDRVFWMIAHEEAGDWLLANC